MRLLVTALWVGLCLSGFAQANSPNSSKPLKQAEPGPWGDLEYYSILLDAPDHYATLQTLPSERTEWHFPGYLTGQVERLLLSVGIPREEVLWLYEQNRVLKMEDGYVVYPSSEYIRMIDPAARSALYTVLGQWERNTFHYHPIVIQDPDLRAWFRGAKVSEAVIQRISDLMYSRGRTLLFSDVPDAVGLTNSAEEERALMQALTRSKSLVMRMKISDESDLQAAADYWSAGFKNKEILPILESAARFKGESGIDVVHLIPPTARRYLYAFPEVEDGLRGRFPDSFWTAINFFQFTPINIYGDSFNIDEYIRTHYERVEGPLKYGDVLILVRSETRQAFHACVYLADNIVYSKNSDDLLSPWILSTIDDLLDYHHRGEPTLVTTWRMKSLIQEPGNVVAPEPNGVIDLP